MSAIAAGVLIRPSTAADAAALADVYGWHVRHGTGTFELDPPDAGEMARRREAVVAAGWPWLVAEQDGVPAGFACAAPLRPRLAYRYCLEDSIYLRPDLRGLGLGRLLLAELLARCEALGARQMVAVIGDAGNAASIGLHRALGFAPVGRLPSVGWKLSRWLDVVMMQRALGPGASSAPDDDAA